MNHESPKLVPVPTLESIGVDLVREVAAQEEPAQADDTPNPKTSSIVFPEDCLVGSIGDYARVMSEGSEVPAVFYFAAGLTMLGAMVANKLRMGLNFNAEPRLYTILLGESYRVKKSTALAHTTDFFTRIAGRLGYRSPIPQEDLPISRWADAEEYKQRTKRPLEVVEFDVITGSPGSAEGLMRKFLNARSIVLALDELKMLIDKAAITGSSLLSGATSLFEKTAWESPIKSKSESAGCLDAHLSILGCCTMDTYEGVWTREAIAIGLVNRLFVVTSDAKPKIAWPRKRKPADLDEIQQRIERQLARLPMELDITPDAEALWNTYTDKIPDTEHARRMDTIGFRLLALVALTTDKTVIDVETVETVCRILEYEYSVRVLTDPVDAGAVVAKLEEKIRRVLDRFPAGLDDRSLRQKTHADRDGLWAYQSAITLLAKHRDIAYFPKPGVYRACGKGAGGAP